MEKKHIPKNQATNKTKLLLSFLGLEFLLFLFVILSAERIVPMSSSRLWLLGLFSVLMLGTGYWLYTENISFYQKHKKKFNVAFTLILLIIPMLFAGYIRSYAYNLPIADDWAENSIMGRLTPQIYNQVKSEYPNLPDDLIQEEVKKRQDQFLEENYEDITSEKEKIASQFRDSFQAENGQTYFLAIDPYYYYTTSNLIHKNGYIGDELIDGTPTLKRRLAPVGIKNTKISFHDWFESKLYEMNGLDETSTPGERTKAVYFLPVLFSMLAIIPLFLIIKLYSNNLFAFLGSLSFSTVTTFLSRTTAGFVDTDAYNVFFPLLIAFFIIYAFNAKNNKTTSIYAILAGLVQAWYLWTWGSAWYTFVFFTIIILAYVIYTLLAEFFEKKKFIIKTLKKELIAFGLFFLSAWAFSLTVGKDILQISYRAVLSSSQGLATAKVGNIWPNVFSSVAELNPASFPSIINSIGGQLIFLVALLGLLLLSIDFPHKIKNYGLYKNILLGVGFIWFSFFVLDFKDMGFLESIHKSLIGLTSNNPLLFVILLFLPMIVAILYALHNTNADKKTFLTILLTAYIAGTIYMSLQAVRFILLLAPMFAIAVGVGLYYLAKLGNDKIKDFLELKDGIFKFSGTILVILLFGFMFVPTAVTAHEISYNSVPNFDDNWYDLMFKIKDNSNPDAIITSWWDFGHFFIAISERGATFDGASQTTPQSHWVGKLLMENDENVSADILKMLTCGGNQAFEIMQEKANDSTGGVFINKIIYSTLGKENKEEILKNNPHFEFSDNDVSEIMEKLSCNNPPENFVIASEDMVGKAGVWAHWGSWNFTKKYILDNYKKQSIEELSNILELDLETTTKLVSELKEIDLKARLKNVKRDDLLNMWLAPYPSYLSDVISCTEENNVVDCQGAITIDLNTKSAKFNSPQNGEFANLVIAKNGTLSTHLQNEDGVVDIVLKEENGNYNVLIAQTPLGASTFTKLFFLNGAGTTKFEKFDYTMSTSGWKIYTWKVLNS